MKKKLIVSFVLLAVCLGMAGIVQAQVQTHGFVLARQILSNNNYTSRIERYGIQFREKIDNEFDWLTEIYIHPQLPASQGGLYMESAYLNWNLSERLPWNFRMRIGKGRNFCYGQTPGYSRRRTSDYSLYSEAFTQLRVSGIQTFSDFGKWQIALAIINPYSFGSRRLPDFPIGDSFAIPICDRDTDNSTLDRIAVSGRLGYKNDTINVGANVYMSDPKEGTQGAKSRFGVDGEVKLENGLLGQVQATMAQTQVNTGAAIEDLDHMGAEVLVGYEKDKIGLYARYGMVTYDDILQDMNSAMVSAVYKIRPRIHLRLEGLINGETTDDTKGWGELDNNVLFFETLFAW